MYMAYGWPQVIPVESSDSTRRIVYLKVISRVLLVVLPAHLELWSSSQHRVRLGKYVRKPESIGNEGENLQAIWSPDSKLIAVLTSQFYLHIFKVQITGKKINTFGKQPTGLFLASVSLVLSERVPFANSYVTFCGAFFLQGRANDELGSHHLGNGLISGATQSTIRPIDPNHFVAKPAAVVHLEFSIAFRMLVVLSSDGEIALYSVSKKGLKHTESILLKVKLASRDAVCSAVAPAQQILAVGTRKGSVELYDLANSASLIRSVSLHDWG
ncbi:hypothetical protein M569_05322 [Genlisea aurea]|uniref:Anaphase-promoting complex subunit 4 WD40 domain-containing protein n=1 Tax=Genlisea aurea TaxID=192259 RepID=S8E1C9_9LAMI|nr:hypothetical protein M569_05322 [Genlisea aurea]